EPFWKLVANAGCEKWVESKSSMRSFSNLTTAVKYALIDKKPIYISSLRGNISKHKNAVSRFLGSIFKNKNIFRHITAFSFTVL
ncbi:MAG: hypothetical protein LBP85_04455, partial [Prevotellaceae bacterium]|nr:hypothetical protein [Prevotellaceae bacterium]